MTVSASLSDELLHMYRPQRPAASQYVPVRDLNYHILSWGRARATTPLLVLCHGWMDVGASFQFLVDALQHQMQEGGLIIAPDWRGFGRTLTPLADHFVLADYLLDLDYLLDYFSPHQTVDLVGHSMGANIVLTYAGLRPERVRCVVNLEGFGLPATTPDMAPDQLVQWMDNVKALRAGNLQLRSYASLAEVAQRLQRTNSRLPTDRALWLATQWARQAPDSAWHIQAHAGHKIPNHQLYHVQEFEQILQRITAPVLCVQATDDSLGELFGGKLPQAEYERRMQRISQVQMVRIGPAGHMLHHDQPEELARLLHHFLYGSQ